MASEKCYKPSEQTNHYAQTTNYYQKTATTDACHDKPKPTHNQHSLADKVKDLAHSATKLLHPNDHHGHAAHSGHCAQGHSHGHGHGHGHSGHGHGHEHGHSGHGHEHGHSAHAHGHGHKPAGLTGHATNNKGHCFPKSHEHKKKKHRENKLNGCSSDSGSSSESESDYEKPKNKC